MHFPSNIKPFRKSAAKNPLQLIPDFKPSILNRTSQTVVGAGAAERQQVRPRLQDPEDLFPHRHIIGDTGFIPGFTHKAQLIGRVTDTGIERGVCKLFEDEAVVAVMDYDFSHLSCFRELFIVSL